MRRILLALLLLLTASLSAGAEEKVLRWAGDSEGGVPFMFNDPKDVNRLIGFEVDIVAAVAKILGRRPVFVNNSWDNLIPGLERKLYDVAINGLEVTPEHEQEVAFSIPYYYTFLQIAVRRDNQDIQKLEDFRGKVAGTLKQSYSYFTPSRTWGTWTSAPTSWRPTPTRTWPTDAWTGPSSTPPSPCTPQGSTRR